MKYFTIDELCISSKAKSKGIKNIPNNEQRENLRLLIENILDPVREHLNRPMTMNDGLTSGFRNQELNKAVGGDSNSYHMKGMAVDIDLGDSADNIPVFNFIKDNLQFTELGWEGNGRWVHVAYDKDNLAKEIFYA